MEGDGIPIELFQILKDDAVKVLHSICQHIWKTQQCHRTGKGQFSFQSQGKAMPKNAQTTAQLHSSHMLVNLPADLKIWQKFGKFSSDHRTGKGQFSFQSQRKAMPKNAQTTA